jgi:hypothetical protein
LHPTDSRLAEGSISPAFGVEELISTKYRFVEYFHLLGIWMNSYTFEKKFPNSIQ